MQSNQLKTLSGQPISSISLGSWVFAAEGWGGANRHDCHKAIRMSFKKGINIIDTAPIYGEGRSEQVVGEVLPKQRDDIFIATKCGGHKKGKKVWLDLSRDSILKEIDQSLDRLNLDVIDLYQIHWAYEDSDIEGAMQTLVDLQKQGKIRYIGVSNFDVNMLKRVMDIGVVATNQMQYSLIDRSIEDEILPFCRENNIGVLAYGPLAGGILTGKYKEAPKLAVNDARSYFYQHYDQKSIDDINLKLDQLKSIGHPLNEIAINWVRQQPGVASVLVGARNDNQATCNCHAFDWELTKEQVEEIGTVFNK